MMAIAPITGFEIYGSIADVPIVSTNGQGKAVLIPKQFHQKLNHKRLIPLADMR
jgi:hypothetical protein